MVRPPVGDCAHFVLNPTTLQLIPHYSSQTVTVQVVDRDRYGRTVGEVLAVGWTLTESGAGQSGVRVVVSLEFR